MTELAAHMAPVARLLLGEPNRELSNGRRLRYGNHGSLSVDLDAGTWFDHEGKVGGGVLDLVRRQLRCDRPGALDWLRRTRASRARPGAAEAGQAPRRRPLRLHRRREPAALPGAALGAQALHPGAARGRRLGRRQGRHEGRRAHPLPPARGAGGRRGGDRRGREGRRPAARRWGSSRPRTPKAPRSGRPGSPRLLAGKRRGRHPGQRQGRSQARGEVAAGLRGKAASVKVLELPGLPEKGDVSRLARRRPHRRRAARS